MAHHTQEKLRRIDALTWYAIFPTGPALICAAVWLMALSGGGLDQAVSLGYETEIRTAVAVACILSLMLGQRLREKLFDRRALESLSTKMTMTQPAVDGASEAELKRFAAFQRNKFLLAAIIDAPMVIGIALGMMNMDMVLLTGIAVFSLIPAFACRPNLDEAMRGVQPSAL